MQNDAPLGKRLLRILPSRTDCCAGRREVILTTRVVMHRQTIRSGRHSLAEHNYRRQLDNTRNRTSIRYVCTRHSLTDCISGAGNEPRSPGPVWAGSSRTHAWLAWRRSRGALYAFARAEPTRRSRCSSVAAGFPLPCAAVLFPLNVREHGSADRTSGRTGTCAHGHPWHAPDVLRRLSMW